MQCASTNLTALYTARYGVPPAGPQVGVRLEAISVTGFRGTGRVVTAVVAQEAMGAASPGDGMLQAA